MARRAPSGSARADPARGRCGLVRRRGRANGCRSADRQGRIVRLGPVLERHRHAAVDVSPRGVGARAAAGRPGGRRTHRRLHRVADDRRHRAPRRRLARRRRPHLRAWQRRAVGVDPRRPRRRRRPGGGRRGVAQTGAAPSCADGLRSLPHRRKGLARKPFAVAADADNAWSAALAIDGTHRRTARWSSGSSSLRTGA